MSTGDRSQLNQLRRRLRGVPASAIVEAVQSGLDSFQSAAIVADNTGRYVAANQRMCDLTGYSLPELLQLNVIDLTPAMRQSAAKHLWRRFIESGTQSGEYTLRRKDGSTLAVQYSAYASIAPGMHLSLLTPAGESVT